MANQKAEQLNKILLGVIALLVVIIIYLLYANTQKTTEIETLTGTLDNKSDEIVGKTKELEAISIEFERVKTERDKLGLNNDSLNAQIDQLNTYIAEVKKTSKFDAKKRHELEEMVKKLRTDISKKDEEIASLKAKNEALTSDVDRLNTEKTKLQDSVSQVSTKKQDLEGRLAYASILKAENFKITVLKENGKEIEDDEYKASKINRLRVAFTLADNKAAQTGNKDFLLRLVTPKGDAFSDPVNGGGSLVTADGKTIYYTIKQTVPFDNGGQKVVFTTFSGLNYVSGIYLVEVYCEGYKIGEGNFKVK